jgi:hypothetical protein
MSRVCVLTAKFPCLQEVPPSDPVEQGVEGDWDTVGGQLEVVGAQPPPWKSFWHRWSASPLLLRGAQSQPLLPLKR